jgi:hypothetical protein
MFQEARMKARRLAFVLVMALAAITAPAFAQQPGEIFGKVADASGAVMPGVSVTVSGGSLLQPMVAVASATGTYRFPGLGVGTYTVKFELAGFKTFVREGIRMEIGANVQINGTMEISTVQETVTVSGETPLVDLRDTSKTSRFTQEALQSIPSARDPWVIIEQSAGVAMDRQNVGGTASGQQSNFVARGAATSQQKWNLDGVDITDMSATGGSPIYFDFDSFEEMQISTGGADVTMQTPGVGVNLVTKSGTDKLRGSGRIYVTDQSLQSNNVTDAMRKNGVNTGNPLQNIKDYGIEAGGPIKKGRAWFWGSYGKQDVRVGINNFYKPDAACQAMKASPLTYSLAELRDCLNTDQTLLNNYNAKLALEPFKNNQFSFYFNAAEKVRNARDASDTRPLETTYRQLGVTNPKYGSSWWKTGMPKTYKWGDRHVFSDRFMVEAQYAHVGNNFALTFHDDSLADVQATYDYATQAYGRSYLGEDYVRPTDSIDVTANYFLPGVVGGDHAFKAGFKYRDDEAISVTHYGGSTWAVYDNIAKNQASEAWLYRDGYTDYVLHNRSFYVQDTYSRRKLTIIAGIRYDYQTDLAKAATVGAHPFYGQKTLTGLTFDQLPEASFDGVKAPVAFKDLSPRIGLTYDLGGSGRTVAKFNFAHYVGQLGTGNLSSPYNPVRVTEVDYPWVDLNGDKYVTANEIDMSKGYLYASSGYDPKNPTALKTTSKVDPNLTDDYTNEFIVGLDHQLAQNLAVSGSFIWRRYSNFRWSPRDNWSSANYTAVQYTPAASACPMADAKCQTITYYQPVSQLPVNTTTTNQPDYYREYRGFEVSARRRMSKNWMLSSSFAWNDAPVFYKSASAYQDPTNIDNLNGGQYAPESTSSGLGNVFINAKWIFRASGAYTLPIWDINLAAFYNSRSGYPFPQYIQGPSRPFGAGRAQVYIDRLGDNRLPNFQTVDFRVDKPVTLFGRVKIVAAMDVFNLTNGHTTLSQRPVQNSTTANLISSILAPRVVRFGFRATF